MIVYGVPSMRILKYTAVFTPEPWHGYGYGEVESMKILEEGKIDGREILWGILTIRLFLKQTGITGYLSLFNELSALHGNKKRSY